MGARIRQQPKRDLGVVGTAGTLPFPTVVERDTVDPVLLERLTFT